MTDRIKELLERVRSQDYNCIDTEQAHDRIDDLAEVVAELVAILEQKGIA